jgi:hypothetical protein
MIMMMMVVLLMMMLMLSLGLQLTLTWHQVSNQSSSTDRMARQRWSNCAVQKNHLVHVFT